MTRSNKMPDESFYVPTSFYAIMRFNDALAPLWMKLSDIESWTYRHRLTRAPLDRPVFICGVARAGTTITLEMLSQHPDVGTHRYLDFVLPYVPIWWNWAVPRIPIRGLDEPVDRIHRDRIKITRHSPEAIEEMIWMRFFPHLHDGSRNNILAADTTNRNFERFYPQHLKKLLAARNRSRYVAKNNYLLTRLAYLLQVLPNARLLVLIRHPVNHIASLMKQHRLLVDLAQREPRQMLLTKLAGHHEFGPYRTCLHLGDPALVKEINRCWQGGREVRGWALLWSSLYGYLSQMLQRNAALREACHIVRYEDLCRQPERVIPTMLQHAGLDIDTFRPVIQEYGNKLSLPSYYQPAFTRRELADISEVTGQTAARFGYTAVNWY